MIQHDDDDDQDDEHEAEINPADLYTPTIQKDKIPALVGLLLDAAGERSVVDYPSVYNLFDNKSTPQECADVWFTFEAACSEICDPQEALYGALMALKANQLPEVGFFATFFATRPDSYRAIAGSTPLKKLSFEQKTEIVQHERERVYTQAASKGTHGV